MKTWKNDIYTVFEECNDSEDLHWFRLEVEGCEDLYIYPKTLEEMEFVIKSLNRRHEIDCRKEGFGETDMDELLGLAEVSELLGWDKRKTSTYLKRGILPKPIHSVKATPLWTLDQIIAYKDKKTLK